MKRQYFVPTRHTVVCSQHFEQSCFSRDASKLAKYGYTGAKNKLKEDGVPTIFSFTAPATIKQPRSAFVKRRRKETSEELIPLLLNASPEEGHVPTCTSGACQTTENENVTEDEHTEDEHTEDEHTEDERTEASYTEFLQKKNKITQVNIKPYMRTRRIQVSPKTRDIGVQVDTLSCDIPTVNDHNLEEDIIDMDEEVRTDQELDDDSEYVPPASDSDSSHSSDEESDDEDITPAPLIGTKEPHEERHFLVSESALTELLSSCRICASPAVATLKRTAGTLIMVEIFCENGHTMCWYNQKMHNGLAWGNINLAAAILFSGSSISKSLHLMQHLNVPVISARSYFKLQKHYLVPTVTDVWLNEQKDLIEAVRGKPLALGGDGRCDSPGYSAKYGSYNVMDLESKKILHTQLVQCNEVKSSYHMELEGLKRSLKLLKDYQCDIKELVTDRHSQIKKFMAENHKDINHYFDVWHVSKGVTKKLEAAGKKKKCQEIQPWIKSIGNHLYWVAGSSGDNKDLKREKWLSVLNHVTNIHDGHGELFTECEHGDLEYEREWLRKGSKAYKMLDEVVSRKLLVKDVGSLSPVHQTYSLEVFHNVVNHFASKQQHFFYPAMECRMYLAAMHFNENGALEQRKTKNGNLIWRICYPKAKKGETAVVKAVKKSPTYGYVDRLKTAVTERRKKLPSYSKAAAQTVTISVTPRSLTDGYQTVSKGELLARHQSRFC